MQGFERSGGKGPRPLVRVRVFKGAGVEVEGRPVVLSPHQAALIALVFGHSSTGPTRTEVAAKIWERDVGPVVRQRLRQLILSTSGKIGHRVIATEGDVLVPNYRIAASDYEDFSVSLREGKMVAAADLLGMGFMSKRVPVVSRAFEDWVRQRRSTLEGNLIQMAARGWDEGRAANDWERALDCAEALFRMKPRDSAEVAKVMEARVRNSQPTAAKAAYALHLERLEPDEAPDPDLRKFAARIDNIDFAQPLPIRSPGSIGERASLVGRSRHMKELVGILDAALCGVPGAILLLGRSGVGKSRLLDEMRTEAQLRGFAWVAVEGVEADRERPFAAVSAALSQIPNVGKSPQAESRPEIGLSYGDHQAPWTRPKWVAEPRTTRSADAGAESPIPPGLLTDSLAFLRRALDRLTNESPTVLCVDDLEWVDDATANLLRVATARWKMPGLVIASALTDGADCSAEVRKYLGDSEGSTLRVGSLGDRDAGELVSSLTEGSVPRTESERIRVLAENRPLELIALTAAWRSGDLSTGLPLTPVKLTPTLEARYDRALRALKPTAVRVAALIALSYAAIPIKSLRRVVGIEDSLLTGSLTRLSRSGHIRVTDGMVGITQPLFRSAVIDFVGPLECAELHRALARRIEREGGSLPALAAHLVGAGDTCGALRVAHEALVALSPGGDRPVGDRPGLLMALDTVVRCTTDAGDKATEAHRAAGSLMESGLLVEALPFLEVAISGFRETEAFEAAVDAGLTRARVLLETANEGADQLRRRLADIDEEASAHGLFDLTAAALSLQVRLAAEHGEPATDVHSRLRRLARPGPRGSRGDDRTRVTALCALAFGGVGDLARRGARTGADGRLDGDPWAGLEDVRKALQLTESSEPTWRAEALLALLKQVRRQGRAAAPALRPFLNEARKAAERGADPITSCRIRLELGRIDFDTGRLGEALSHLNRCDTAAEKRGLRLIRFSCRIARGEVRLDMKEVEKARAEFEGLHRELDGCSPPALRGIAQAGIGSCDLATGAIRAAIGRKRNSLPEEGRRPLHFLQIAYRARLEAARKRPAEAVEALERESDFFLDRNLPTWIRLRTLEAALSLRHRLPMKIDRLQETLRVAESLGFADRAGELEVLVKRASFVIPAR